LLFVGSDLPYRATVAETAGDVGGDGWVNQALFTIQASGGSGGGGGGADAGATIDYAIVGGNQLGFFELDSGTGVFSQVAPIDFEALGKRIRREGAGGHTISGSSATFEVEVRARETAAPFRSANTAVTVVVTDVNDNPPTFEPSAGWEDAARTSGDGTIFYRVFVALDQTLGSKLLALDVADADAAPSSPTSLAFAMTTLNSNGSTVTEPAGRDTDDDDGSGATSVDSASDPDATEGVLGYVRLVSSSAAAGGGQVTLKLDALMVPSEAGAAVAVRWIEVVASEPATGFAARAPVAVEMVDDSVLSSVVVSIAKPEQGEADGEEEVKGSLAVLTAALEDVLCGGDGSCKVWVYAATAAGATTASGGGERVVVRYYAERILATTAIGERASSLVPAAEVEAQLTTPEAAAKLAAPTFAGDTIELIDLGNGGGADDDADGDGAGDSNGGAAQKADSLALEGWAIGVIAAAAFVLCFCCVLGCVCCRREKPLVEQQSGLRADSFHVGMVGSPATVSYLDIAGQVVESGGGGGGGGGGEGVSGNGGGSSTRSTDHSAQHRGTGRSPSQSGHLEDGINRGAVGAGGGGEGRLKSFDQLNDGDFFRAFEEFDHQENSDGKISVSELKRNQRHPVMLAAMRHAGVDIDTLIARIDTNQDRQVDVLEFLRGIHGLAADKQGWAGRSASAASAASSRSRHGQPPPFAQPHADVVSPIASYGGGDPNFDFTAIPTLLEDFATGAGAGGDGASHPSYAPTEAQPPRDGRWSQSPESALAPARSPHPESPALQWDPSNGGDGGSQWAQRSPPQVQQPLQPAQPLPLQERTSHYSPDREHNRDW
jgi:hypothetical protein